jgi:hypothetical protein
MTGRRKSDHRELVREALGRAAGDGAPDVSRIADAVPAMIAEARRRRAFESRVGTIDAVVPLARRAIPAMAAAAAVLALVATFVGYRADSGTVDGMTELDRLILTGEVSSHVSDVLLEAMTERGNDDG